MFAIVVAVIVVATGAIAARSIVSNGALETHEIFVAQTAREMIARGDLVVPTFGSELRLQKPPLMYWAVIGVSAIASRPDIPEWVARTPSAISAMILALSAALIGARVFDRRTGLIAGAGTGFSLAVFEFGANARPEMLYAACTALATLGWVSAPRAARSARWALAGWAACGLAILAKGPHLPMLAFAGISAWHIRASGWKHWARTMKPFAGIAIALAVSVPWVIAVALRVDDPFGTWAHELVGERFASGASGFDFGSWILAAITPRYPAYLIVLLIPLGVMVPAGAIVPWLRTRTGIAAGRDLFWGVVVPMAVLSVAVRARGYYLLPILPMGAPLAVRGTLDLLDLARRSARGRAIAACILSAIAVGAVGMFLTVEILSRPPAIEWAIGAAAFALAGGGGLWVMRIRNSDALGRLMILALASWGAAFGALGHHTVISNERPGQVDAIARAARDASAGSLTVGTIGFDKDDLIYRVNRPITRLPRDAAPDEVRALAPAIIVASPKALDRLAGEGVVLERGTVFPVESTDRFEVARVLAPN